MIEAGGVEAAAQDVIAELQRIVVRVEAVEVQLLGQLTGILHRLRVGHVGGGSFVHRNRRQRRIRLGPRRPSSLRTIS